MSTPMPETGDRKARALTAGLSAVGATAGAAGLAYAGQDMRRARRLSKLPAEMVPKMETKIPLKAKALVPLEVAGLGGELLATHFLHGDAKKMKQPTNPTPVVKANTMFDPRNGSGKRIVNDPATEAAAGGAGVLGGAVAMHRGIQGSLEVQSIRNRAKRYDAGSEARANKIKAVRKPEMKWDSEGAHWNVKAPTRMPIAGRVGRMTAGKLRGSRAAIVGGAMATAAGVTGLDHAMDRKKLSDVGKARYFDPEADRQRRTGAVAGVSAGGAIVAANQAGKRLEFEGPKGQTAARPREIRGLRVKGGVGRKGALIASGATAALGGLAAASYGRGISRRNQPWT